MPGLPKNLVSTYQTYKNHTDTIAEWLASTARKHGFTSPKAKKTNKTPNPSQGRPTYTVATKEWTEMAEFIANLSDPPVNVPSKLATLLETTISLRQSFSNNLSDILEDTSSKRDSDASHDFFLSVLKKVHDILKPRLPKERPSSKKPSTVEEIINVFEHLELEEPSAEFEQAPDIPAVSPVNRPIYRAERQNDIQEACFAFSLLLHDLTSIRREVSRAWEGYKQGVYDLVAASISTNTATDLARSMVDDLKGTFAKHGGASRMLDVYYMAMCMEAGTTANDRVRTGDDMNFAMYDAADALFLPAAQTLTAFCNVMKVGPDPQMKRGIYGHYDPQSKRKSKSNREKFTEDKILLLEMLEEFYFFCRFTGPTGSRPPVEDEFTCGLREMFKTKESNLPLAFAATLFLDIHHILREEVDNGFKRLTEATHFIQGDIKEEISFHDGIEMETWPTDNDRFVLHFTETLDFWCHNDQQRICSVKLKRVNIPAPFILHRRHPWLCGLWKYYAQMRFHELSIVFVNAWGSVMSCAHLYNAVGGGTHRDSMWRDMDVVIGLQNSKTFLVGEAPTAADDCLKRFALAMGASAANLAKSTRKKKGLTLSKRGPKGLKELGDVLQTFKERFCNGSGQTNIAPDDVHKILEKASWEHELDEDGHVLEVYKDTDEPTEMKKKPSTSHLHVSKLLSLLCDVLNAEMVEIAFDYLRLHRMCWRLLRALKDACRDKLISMYGPDYIEKESQLPFVVGYVLMSASSEQQVGDILKARLPGVQVTDAVVAAAKTVVKTMIDQGAGALIVEKILPTALGVQIDFEFE